jgi:hypothetical protein
MTQPTEEEVRAAQETLRLHARAQQTAADESTEALRDLVATEAWATVEQGLLKRQQEVPSDQETSYAISMMARIRSR